jgi:hypothetical protein
MFDFVAAAATRRSHCEICPRSNARECQCLQHSNDGNGNKLAQKETQNQQ